MISKSRFVLALGLTLALGLVVAAYGDDNKRATAQVFVDGAVNPTNQTGGQPSGPIKIKHGKTVAVKLYTGVRTQDTVTGSQANPAAEFISFGKLLTLDTGAVPQCTTIAPSGSTPQQAKDSCPEKSFLGSGTASLAGTSGFTIKDVTVSAFAGTLPGKRGGGNGLLLHTYSPTLGTAAPTVQGFIVKSNAGSKYGQALDVPHAPETGALQIDSFNANIEKSSKTVLAQCNKKKGKKGKYLWLRATTFTDGSKTQATATQACKAK